VFVSAVAPSGVSGNEYYPAEAAYLDAVADALNVEYTAIADAGFTLQIDDPFLTGVFSYPVGSAAENWPPRTCTPGRSTGARETGCGCTPATASTKAPASTTRPWPT
jgi:hypothetical protein